MSMLKRLWWAGLFGIALTGIVFFLGCEALPFEFDVPVQSSTTIEKGTLLEMVIGDFGFSDLTTFDISNTQQFKNNNAQKDQVVTAKMTKLTLSITEPADQNFDFLDSITFYVAATGEEKTKIASKTISKGVRTFELELEEVDLAKFIKKDSISITTDVKGRRPSKNTTVKIDANFRIGARL